MRPYVRLREKKNKEESDKGMRIKYLEMLKADDVSFSSLSSHHIVDALVALLVVVVVGGVGVLVLHRVAGGRLVLLLAACPAGGGLGLGPLGGSLGLQRLAVLAALGGRRRRSALALISPRSSRRAGPAELLFDLSEPLPSRTAMGEAHVSCDSVPGHVRDRVHVLQIAFKKAQIVVRGALRRAHALIRRLFWRHADGLTVCGSSAQVACLVMRKKVPVNRSRWISQAWSDPDCGAGGRADGRAKVT